MPLQFNQNLVTQPGIFTKSINALFGGIGTVGQILDTPGSIVRGLLAGDLERALGGIFDTSKRVSGSELAGEDPNELSLQGFATEIFTDPLSYLTFGAKTAAGTLAKRAGKLAKEARVLDEAASVTGQLSTKQRALSSNKALSSVQQQLAALGRKDLDLAPTIREQLKTGQRSLIQFQPFGIGAGIDLTGSFGSDTIGSIAEGLSKGSKALKLDVAGKAIKNKFSNSLDNISPELEILRKERERLIQEKNQRTLNFGHELQKTYNLLASTDPTADDKIIKALEIQPEYLQNLRDQFDALKPSNPAEYQKAIKLLDTRLQLESELAQIPKEIMDFAGVIRQEFDNLQTSARATGVPTFDLESGLGYFTRLITPEGIELLKKNGTLGKSVTQAINKIAGGNVQSFQMNRTFRDQTVEEINKALIKEYNLPSNFTFFDKDIVRVVVTRGLKQNKIEGNALFSSMVAKEFAQQVEGESISKLFKPPIKQEGGKFRYGPLVISTRIPVTQTKEGIKQAVKSRLIKFEPLGKKGLKLGPVENNDVIDNIVEASILYGRSPKAFARLSPAHKAIGDNLDTLTASGVLAVGDNKILKTILSQVDLEQTRNELGKLVKIINDNKIPSLYRQADNVINFNPDTAKQISQLAGSSISPETHMFRIILHELGHSLDLKDTIRQSANKNISSSRLVGNANLYQKFKAGGSANPMYHAGFNAPFEPIAEGFAQYLLGYRTNLKGVNEFYKSIHDQIKTWKQGIVAAGLDQEPVSEMIQSWLRSPNDFVKGLKGSPRARFVDDFLQPFQNRDNYIEIDPKAPAKSIERALKAAGVEKRYISPEIYAGFEKAIMMTKTPEILHPVLKIMDEITGIYKSLLVKYWPGSIARDWFSGVFMNTLAGVTNPAHYYRAVQKLKSMEPEEIVYLAGLKVINAGRLHEVYELLGSGQNSIRERTAELLGLGFDKVGGRPIFNKLADAAHGIDRTAERARLLVDNHTRLAHFLAKKAEGLSDTEAAESVVKYLFDYGDLTNFERAVPRRTMLFYTFFRKNLPLMVESIFTNPRFMMNYARATGRTNTQNPDWLNDSFFFNEDEKGNQIRINFGLPPEDLARFDPEGKGLQRVLELMLSNTVPVIKEPIQTATQRNLATGRPMDGSGVERLAAALPTSRLTGTIGRYSKASEEEGALLPEIARTLTGIGVRNTNKKDLATRLELQGLKNRLDELYRGGSAKKSEIYFGEDPEIKQINSMLARKRAQLTNQ